MKKHDLLRNEGTIIRVLEIKPDKVLVIDCIKRTMPVWVESSTLDSYCGCTGEELSDATGFIVTDMDTLDAEQRKAMYNRYTLIAPIIPFVANEIMRSRLICSIATEHGVSKQTVRNYLCLYLAYLDMTILAPKKWLDENELTQDEKNMRWALNKFFYATAKQSLTTAYTMMLKEKYCEEWVFWLIHTRPFISFATSIVKQGKCRISISPGMD